MSGLIILDLPLPPSPNETNSLHPMQLHRRKRKYQTTCWAAAISQSRPSRDPAGLVKVDAHFRLHNLRDETDNLPASLKWTLDALRQAQQGSVGWRQGVYDKCGYFLDDDPRHLSTGAITQVIDRRNKGLTLSLTYSE